MDFQGEMVFLARRVTEVSQDYAVSLVTLLMASQVFLVYPAQKEIRVVTVYPALPVSTVVTETKEMLEPASLAVQVSKARKEIVAWMVSMVNLAYVAHLESAAILVSLEMMDFWAHLVYQAWR